MSDGRVDSGGRLTTTIARPKGRRASDAGRSRLGDIGRRRIPRADRIAPRRRSAWLFGLAALVVAGAIGGALFLLPVRTWFDQDDQLRGLEHELRELQTVNDDLEDEVDRLGSDLGIIEAAREELGHILPADNRQTMQPLPPLPQDLPDGWPYSQVGQIIAIREATAAAAPDAATDSGDDNGGWVRPSITPAPTVAATTTPPTSSPAATTVPAATGATTMAVSTTNPIPSTGPAAP